MRSKTWSGRLSLLAAALLATLAGPGRAAAESWSCRNEQLEIRCPNGVCKASESHTPMDVVVGADRMTVCAYTGCWEGKAAAAPRVGRMRGFFGEALAFSTDPSRKVDIAVVVDAEARVATVLVADLFAAPMTCEAR